MASFQTRVTRFFHWCSGACPDALEKMDLPLESTKYFCLGGAICTTWTFATIAGFFALQLIFPQYLLSQYFFAIIWGLIIFNIDRLIAITLTKSVDPNDFGADHFFNFLKILVQASPRILMAIIIGFVVSKPLELRIFKVEITAKMEEKLREALAKEKSTFNQQHIKTLEYFDNKEKELIKQDEKVGAQLTLLRQQYTDEIDGTAGTEKIGVGKIARIKEKLYLDEEKKLLPKQRKLEKKLEYLVTQRDDELKVVRERFEESKKSILNTFSNGILDRLKALSNLTRTDDTAYWTDLLVFTLILIIEMLPIIVKLLSPVGAYDYSISHKNNQKIKEITSK